MDDIANILSIIIPYFFIALWVLVPTAIIWAIALFIKKSKNKD